jgi:alkanesulfonate monooxygenase SsuD/methylene tetrahydromethanopterin reductase-like flavin-dependent oxidoreductase (luciferase family)
VDPRVAARNLIERAAAARRAGLDSLFVGDHHVTPAPYFQNVPTMGRLLAEWCDKPAGCLFLLPLWNPVLVAEQVGTLAAFHAGRFIIQCALGSGRDQFAGIGADHGKRPSLFEEGLDIVRRLLAGETVDGGARYPEVRGARISPTPAEPVDVWIGGSVEASIDRAARLGDAWLAGPELQPEDAATWCAYYVERCRERGRVPGVVAIRRDIYVGESDAEAERVAGAVIARGYRGFDPAALVYGSPDTVAAKFRRYRAMGFTDVIVRHIVNDQAHVLASYARLGEVKAVLT